MQDQNFAIIFKDGTEATFDKICEAFAVVSHREIHELVCDAAETIIIKQYNDAWDLQHWYPIGGNKIRLILSVWWGSGDSEEDIIEIDIRRVFDSAFNFSEINREIQESKAREERRKKENEEADRLRRIQNARKAIEQNVQLLREAGIEPDLTGLNVQQ